MLLFQRDELMTVEEVRRKIRPLTVGTSTNWRVIARKYVKTAGSILIWLADDTIVHIRVEDGKTRQTSHKPGSWRLTS